MTESICPTEQPVLNSALFVRENWDGGVICARLPCGDLSAAHYAISGEEVLFLRRLEGTRNIGESIALSTAANPNSRATLEHFAGWAFKHSILVKAREGSTPVRGRFDPSLFDTAGGIREPRMWRQGTRTQWPVFITFLPTLQCQSQCAYCFLERRDVTRPGMAFDRVTELLDECRDLRIFQWRLAGGEVLLYPDLYRLLRGLSARGMFLGRPITTKMAVPGDTLRRLLDSGVTEIQYSLDAVDPNLLDLLVSRRGSTADYINAVLAAIREAAAIGLDVSVRPTITNRTFEHIPDLVSAVAAAAPVRMVFGIVNASGSACGNRFALDRRQGLLVQELLDHARERHRDLAMDIKIDSADALANGDDADITRRSFATTREFVRTVSCPGNRHILFVLPDGRCTVCTMPSVRDAIVLGDLCRESIMAVWSSAGALELAYPERAGCHGSPCDACDDFSECHLYAGKCLALVANVHGPGNLHFPDPRCPQGTLVNQRACSQSDQVGRR